MKETGITAILAGGCVVLAALAGVGIFTRDNQAPVIRLEGKNQLTYTEGEDQAVLLEGITAKDSKDGDVTESVRVTNILPTDDGNAIVVYVAKDQSNNVGTLKREVRYQALEEPAEEETPEEDQEEETQQDSSTETDQDADSSEEDEEEDNSQDQADQGEGPQLKMIQNEATVKVGEGFNVLRYVESAVDVDGKDLSRSIHISGDYNLEAVGSYTIKVYATGADGKTSNVEVFTLTVEE